MSDDIKKGLLGIVVDETEVSKVMPEINSLTYRGYAAQDLCEYCRFEEVAYLILNKDLPNSIELKQFEKEEKNNAVHWIEVMCTYVVQNFGRAGKNKAVQRSGTNSYVANNF